MDIPINISGAKTPNDNTHTLISFGDTFKYLLFPQKIKPATASTASHLRAVFRFIPSVPSPLNRSDYGWRRFSPSRRIGAAKYNIRSINLAAFTSSFSPLCEYVK